MNQPEPIPGPGPAGPPTEATLLLRRTEAGDSAAAAELLPLVYEQLRATAGSFFRAQRSDHTLQPTALVHEAYLKLVGSPGSQWENRTHFCAVAAKAMRQILQDHARGKRTLKRGGNAVEVTLTGIQSPTSGEVIDLLALDEALSTLFEIDERGARIVELRYFGGLTNEQIADVLAISCPTVERDWRRVRAWLRVRLSAASEPDRSGPIGMDGGGGGSA